MSTSGSNSSVPAAAKVKEGFKAANLNSPAAVYLPTAMMTPALVLDQTYRAIKNTYGQTFIVHVFYQNKYNAPRHRANDTIANTEALVALFAKFKAKEHDLEMGGLPPPEVLHHK